MTRVGGVIVGGKEGVLDAEEQEDLDQLEVQLREFALADPRELGLVQVLAIHLLLLEVQEQELLHVLQALPDLGLEPVRPQRLQELRQAHVVGLDSDRQLEAQVLDDRPAQALLDGLHDLVVLLALREICLLEGSPVDVK